MIIQRATLLALPSIETARTATAEETLQQLQNQYRSRADVPRLILLDLYLPSREEGLQLISHLKTAGGPFQQIPIVLVSGSSQSQDIIDTHQAGVNSYVIKPARFDQWLDLFHQIRSYWWTRLGSPPVNRFLF